MNKSNPIDPEKVIRLHKQGLANGVIAERCSYNRHAVGQVVAAHKAANPPPPPPSAPAKPATPGGWTALHKARLATHLRMQATKTKGDLS